MSFSLSAPFFRITERCSIDEFAIEVGVHLRMDGARMPLVEAGTAPAMAKEAHPLKYGHT